MPAKPPRAKRVLSTSTTSTVPLTASSTLAALEENEKRFEERVREITDSLRSRRGTALVQWQGTATPQWWRYRWKIFFYSFRYTRPMHFYYEGVVDLVQRLNKGEDDV